MQRAATSARTNGKTRSRARATQAMAAAKITITETSTPRSRAPACPRLLVSVTRLVIRSPAIRGKNPVMPKSAPTTIAAAMSCFPAGRTACACESYQAVTYDSRTCRPARDKVTNSYKNRASGLKPGRKLHKAGGMIPITAYFLLAEQRIGVNSMRRANHRAQAMAWARADERADVSRCKQRAGASRMWTAGACGRQAHARSAMMRVKRFERERALHEIERRRLSPRCRMRPHSPSGILPADERCGRHEGPCDVASERFSRREASAKSGAASAAASFRIRRLPDPPFASKAKPPPRSPTGRFRTATLRGAASVMNRLKFSDIVPQAAQRQLKAPGKASFPFVSVHYLEKTPIYLPQRAQERLGTNDTVQYRRKSADSLPCRERRIRRKLQMP